MDYYKVLEVSRTASIKDIKKSYKQLVKKYHPDVFEGDKSVAENKIKEINEAYDVLSNPETKKEYDESLEFHSSENNINYSSEPKTPNTSNSDYSSPKYEDVYKYDYYKKYTTNYYGVSKERPHVNNNVNNSKFDESIFSKNKAPFIIVVGICMIVVLIILIFLLSSFKKYFNGTANFIDNVEVNSFVSDNTTEEYRNLPLISYGMTYNEVKAALGAPDFVETKEGDRYYAYWGSSYIIFDEDDIVVGWRNTGNFRTGIKVETDIDEQLNNLYNSIEPYL